MSAACNELDHQLRAAKTRFSASESRPVNAMQTQSGYGQSSAVLYGAAPPPRTTPAALLGPQTAAARQRGRQTDRERARARKAAECVWVGSTTMRLPGEPRRMVGCARLIKPAGAMPSIIIQAYSRVAGPCPPYARRQTPGNGGTRGRGSHAEQHGIRVRVCL